MCKKLRILLAEDHQIVRAGIKMLINFQSDMEVVGEADNGNAVILQVSEQMPDIVLMDVTLPELNGLKTTKVLRKKIPDIKILILTSHTDDGYIQQHIQAGVKGYILKQSAPVELFRAIRSLAEGKSYLDPMIVNKVMGNRSGNTNSHALPGEKNGEITGRETEILRMTALGYASKEIADRLLISVKTVESHKYSAMHKMNMRNRVDIVRYAILQGWLEDKWLEDI